MTLALGAWLVLQASQQPAFLEGSIAPLPQSLLTQALGMQFSEGRYARNGVLPFVKAVLAEDASCVWAEFNSSELDRTSPSLMHGWARLFLPEGTTKGRELIRFVYFPDTRAVGAFTLSQSKGVEQGLQRQKTQRLYRDTGDVALALDKSRIVAVTSESPFGPMDSKAFAAAALLDVDQRGDLPTPGAAVRQEMNTRGERIGVALNGTRALIAESGQDWAIAYSYDTKRNAITPLRGADFSPNMRKGGKPVVPKLYDFATHNAFYDFIERADEAARTWTEWDGKRQEWRRFAIPPGEPGPVFYARGTLFAQMWNEKAQSWNEQGAVKLYKASADRKSWELVGPYVVLARNASDSAWLVVRTTDKKSFLAKFD